jgi:hypothetical protein
METFLQQTANDLYNKFGEDLTKVAVVFPNNRAKLFFSENLYKIAGKPVWTPGFIAISDLFKEQSNLKVADQITLNGILYKEYIRFSNNKEETFDEFYPWGEILLSDFDDTDKNLADAKQLFCNIKDQARYTDTLEHLSEEQVSSIRLFFKNFKPDRKTELKQRFIDNWNILSDVYESFRNTLENSGLAYEGMIYRKVIEKIKSEGVSGFKFEKYAFVGFNFLSNSETMLFKYLKDSGKALFYWDYDKYYLNNPRHEAGRFIRQNLELFGNETGKTAPDNFEKGPKNIRYISSSTENAQARYLPEWIKELKEKYGNDFNAGETAVVLCNENLLLPVLHSIPDDISELNVTMGFPLSQTPVFNLLNEIATLHSDGYKSSKEEKFNYRYVLPVLQHPFMRQISSEAENIEKQLKRTNTFMPRAVDLQADEYLKIIFTPTEDSLQLSELMLELLKKLATENSFEKEEENKTPENAEVTFDDDNIDFDPMYSEAIFRCFTALNRLSDQIKQGVIEVNKTTFRKLLLKILTTISIPFSGEPVCGLQIMGMLETRNLDFKNVMMLSVNEGMLPKSNSDISFIPYNLRKGFSLTTSEYKDSIFAYYFYRILQRAENICLVYNTSTEGINRGEMSRFMLQLLVESGHQTEHFNLDSGIELSKSRVLTINKTDEIINSLKLRYDRNLSPNAKTLSPTALNSYLDCQLRFYLRYVADLKIPEEITEEIDGALFGNIFHHSAQYIYTKILLDKNKIIYDNYDFDLNKVLETGSISGQIEAKDLDEWLKNENQIESVVNQFLKKDFFRIDDHKAMPELNGEQIIKKKIITGFVKSLLKYDKSRTPFSIFSLEKNVSEILEIETEAGIVNLSAGGIIDRIDLKDGNLIVIDYKTGGVASTPNSVENIFISDKKRASHVFQILLYCLILQKKYPNKKITPNILYMNMAESENFDTSVKIGNRNNKISIDDFSVVEEEFCETLNSSLKNLFNNEISFQQTDVAERCEWCDYKNICRRVKD